MHVVEWVWTGEVSVLWFLMFMSCRVCYREVGRGKGTSNVESKASRTSGLWFRDSWVGGRGTLHLVVD